ncbi:uncharacterized protein LOC143037071 [Oratosquilla oratoria]|uniref:uncharacterized protein LOC143037071 n=1 Tax=Oratosquilla oratoria TaxID=337810 RepID=UPI003F76F720
MILKVAVALAALVAVCLAMPDSRPTYLYAAPSESEETHERAYVRSSEEDYGPAKYDFNYAVKDDDSGNDFGHQETRDGDRTEGSYYVQLPDGRLQKVTYYVDGDSGFVANVEYEGEAHYPEPESSEEDRAYAPPPQSLYGSSGIRCHSFDTAPQDEGDNFDENLRFFYPTSIPQDRNHQKSADRHYVFGNFFSHEGGVLFRNYVQSGACLLTLPMNEEFICNICGDLKVVSIVAVALAAIVTVCLALPDSRPTYLYAAPSESEETHERAYVRSSEEDYGPAKYDFNYAVKDEDSGNDFGHQETRDGDRTEGSYYVQLPDGRLQKVTYYVDGDSGFVANVEYEGEAHYPEPESSEEDRAYAPPPQSLYGTPNYILLSFDVICRSLQKSADHHYVFGNFFSHEDGVLFRKYVQSVMRKLDHKYNTNEWRLFIVSSNAAVALAALVTVCLALPDSRPTYLYAAPSESEETHERAYVRSSEEDYGPAKYDFNYAVKDEDSGNDFGHQETRDGDRTEGSYYVQLPDGRLQKVTYYVDGDSGFVANVEYEGEAHYPEPESSEEDRAYAPPPQSLYGTPN